MGKVKDFMSRGFNSTTFLWARLSPGTQVHNLVTFYYAVLMTIACYTFINAAQPYVLENMLGLEDLGKATGDLGFYNELLIIATVWLWGLLSDKIGRKPVYFFAFFFMSVGICLYPFATEFATLVGFRLIFAFGASAGAAMLTSVLADYVIDKDKGTASGFTGLFSGCGALLAALLLLKIPSWTSLETVAAGKVMFLVSGGLVQIAAWVVLIGLQRKPTTLQQNHSTPYHVLLWEGVKAAYYDPRLALAYCSGFVARGDALVLTTFLSLWIQEYAQDVLGHSEEEAISLAGSITGIAQTFALIFALPAGFMASRIDSVAALFISSIVALIGYGSMCFLEDPTGSWGMFCACIVGVGEIAIIVTAQSLASQQAPPRVRGAVGGTVGFFGSLGILFCSKLGGYLYDEWDPTGPFLLFACCNGFLLIASGVTYLWTRRTASASINDDKTETSKLLGHQRQDESSETTQPV